MENSKNIIEETLLLANIKINGNDPWDIQVNDNRLFDRVLRDGSLGLGEAYMDKWWDCKMLDEFFYRVLSSNLDKKIEINWNFLCNIFLSRIFNQQAGENAFVIGKKHYDIGNDLFVSMLGETMAYSCAYWSGKSEANNLDEAQEAKYDLICRKLDLKPGMTVLDIGCGWGTFLRYAALRYGINGLGITVSKDQADLARELCKGLPIEIRLRDYRNIDDRFDRIVSIGMIEHVGYKNYRNYMNIVHQCLEKDGLFLLQAIGGDKSVTTTDPWIAKYIFPNSHLPSIKQIGSSVEDIFVMENWHNFGADYDKTLMAWNNNFEKSWPKIKHNYDERFYRMWRYYLLSCAGSFRARKIQLWQIVFSKAGVIGGYKSIY